MTATLLVVSHSLIQGHPGRPTGRALALLRLRGTVLPDAAGADGLRHAIARWHVPFGVFLTTTD